MIVLSLRGALSATKQSNPVNDEYGSSRYSLTRTDIVPSP
jgi:hypothetical protein